MIAHDNKFGRFLTCVFCAETSDWPSPKLSNYRLSKADFWRAMRLNLHGPVLIVFSSQFHLWKELRKSALPIVPPGPSPKLSNYRLSEADFWRAMRLNLHGPSLMIFSPQFHLWKELQNYLETTKWTQSKLLSAHDKGNINNSLRDHRMQ